MSEFANLKEQNKKALKKARVDNEIEAYAAANAILTRGYYKPKRPSLALPFLCLCVLGLMAFVFYPFYKDVDFSSFLPQAPKSTVVSRVVTATPIVVTPTPTQMPPQVFSLENYVPLPINDNIYNPLTLPVGLESRPDIAQHAVACQNGKGEVKIPKGVVKVFVFSSTAPSSILIDMPKKTGQTMVIHCDQARSVESPIWVYVFLQ